MARKIYKSLKIISDEFNKGGNRKKYENIPNEDETLYKWKCSDCGEIWETTKNQRIIKKKGNCHYCTNQKVRRHESLGVLYPGLKKEWSKNNLKSIYHYSPKNQTEVEWHCTTCGDFYKRRIHSRVNGNKCDCEDSILVNYPDISKEIQDLDPKLITTGSHKICLWKCQKSGCGYIWKCSVNERINGKKSCPKCKGNVAEKGSCLADTHRELMSEWDFEKNNISPFLITSKNGSILINWKCKNYPNEHKWQTKLEKRVSKKPTRCKFCYGTKSTSLIESIKTTHPDIANQWNYSKNVIDISTVRGGSGTKVWWKCNDCGHEWQATPANRTGVNKTGCKTCSDKINKKGQSKIEAKVREQINKIYKTDSSPKNTNFTFKSKMPVSVDFFLEEISLAFDIDPYYTHKNRFKIDSEKSSILKNYCNFFKFREHPLTITSENDIVYDFDILKNIDQFCDLLFKKIDCLYPNLKKMKQSQ